MSQSTDSWSGALNIPSSCHGCLMHLWQLLRMFAYRLTSPTIPAFVFRYVSHRQNVFTDTTVLMGITHSSRG